MTLQNHGGATGEYTVGLRADGEAVTTKTVTVPAGATTSSMLAFAPEDAGTYDIAVGPAALGSLTVTAEDDDEAAASADEAVDEGSSAAVNVDGNSGDDTGGTGGAWMPAVALLVGVLLVSVFVFRRRDEDRTQ